MKLINYYIAIFFASSIFALETSFEPSLINYYKDVYQVEKNKFFKCIEAENLPTIERIYTKCSVSSSYYEAVHFMQNKINASQLDLLEDFKIYKKKHQPELLYPSTAADRSLMGYVIVKFDILETGKTTNHEVVNGFCGDAYNPMTEFKSCAVFNASAISGARRIVYEPTYFMNKPIAHIGITHKFTFLMAQNENTLIKKGIKDYNKMLNLINNNDLNGAMSLADKNINNDIHFIYQKGKIHLLKKEYAMSVNSLQKFIDKSATDNHWIQEEYYVNTFRMLVEGLFGLSKFQEVVNLEKNYSRYYQERDKFKGVLAMTDFYIGASFANSGNFSKATYYMVRASRNAASPEQKDFINSFLKEVSSYL